MSKNYAQNKARLYGVYQEVSFATEVNSCFRYFRSLVRNS